MRSYRRASGLQGVAYLIVVLSLLLKPPGQYVAVKTTAGKMIDIPQHQTFFQIVVGGTPLWSTLFVIGAVSLIVCAIWRPENLGGVHAFLMSVTAAFGVGYLVAGVTLELGFLAGAMSLVACAGHALAVKVRPYAPLLDPEEA